MTRLARALPPASDLVPVLMIVLVLGGAGAARGAMPPSAGSPGPGAGPSASGSALPGAPLDHTLYFVMNATASTADRGALADGQPTVLGTLYDTNVAAYTPGLDASAVKVHATPEFCALVGDVDGDGDFFEVHGDDIDALGIRRREGSGGPTTTPRLVFSTQTNWGTAAPQILDDKTGALDGSLFSIGRGPDGQRRVELFLAEVFITVALGQGLDPETADVDVDAFAQDELGNVFLSFRATEDVNGTSLDDDGVVCLPFDDLAYNGQGNVFLVTPGCARIVLDKDRVSALVAAIGLTTAAGSPVNTIGDLQALDFDPAGGTFEPVQPVPGLPEGVPHLLINGQRLGATVLSTRDEGSIGTLNGCPLGSAVMSGVHLGLEAASTGSSSSDLNGLLVRPREPPQVCVDAESAEVELAQDGIVAFRMGNLAPGGWAWALGAFDAPGPFGDATSTPAAPGSVYPELLVPAPFFGLPVPVDARGRARLELTSQVSLPFSFRIVLQVYELGSARLSAPAVAWCPFG